MSSDIDSGPEKSSPGLELLRVSTLLAVVAAQLFLASRAAKVPFAYCFTRPFWLDEFHTLTVVQEERADQLLSKLARGGDFNPPGLHLILWLIYRATPLSDEALLRGFSCTCGAAGLAATYFLLRARFGWRVSWLSALGMVSSSPQLLQQMFEARTYSFWFASIAVFCLLLTRPSTRSWATVAIGAAAVAMCSIHYFGIIVLGVIAGSQLCCNFHEVRQRWLIGTACTAGVIALVAWLPLYFSQRGSVPVATWIPSPTLGGSGTFIAESIVTCALTMPVLAYGLQLLVYGPGSASSESGLEFKVFAGTCGLILWPLVLTAFSYIIQPAQVARYAVPTALAYAPLIALISRRLKQNVLTGLGFVFFIVGFGGALVVYEIRPDYREAIPLVRSSSVERPLVVHWRVVAYPLVRYTRADPNAVRISYLFRGEQLSRFDDWEQAVARRMGELFELPKTLETDELASLNEFCLLAVKGEEARYRSWTAEPLGPVVGPLYAYRMVRSSGASSRPKRSGADGATSY